MTKHWRGLLRKWLVLSGVWIGAVIVTVIINVSTTGMLPLGVVVAWIFGPPLAVLFVGWFVTVSGRWIR